MDGAKVAPKEGNVGLVGDASGDTIQVPFIMVPSSPADTGLSRLT